jgi:hypothetical protein
VEEFNQKEMILQNDSTANTMTFISGGSTIISFATTWLPVVSLIAATIGILSGVLGAIYYIKKIKE